MKSALMNAINCFKKAQTRFILKVNQKQVEMLRIKAITKSNGNTSTLQYENDSNFDTVLFDLHLGQRNLDKALDLAKKYDAGGDWWWRSRLGICLKKQNDHVGGDEKIQEALQIQDMISLRYEAFEMNDLDFTEKKLQVLQAIHKSNDKDIKCVQLLHGMKNIEAKKLFALDPYNFECLNEIAQSTLEHEPEKSVRCYQRMLEFGKDSLELYCNLGIAAVRAKQFDVAWRAFTRALEYPEAEVCSELWYNVGIAAFESMELDTALRSLKICIDLDQENADAWEALSKVYRLQLQYKESHDCARKCERLRMV